MSVHGFLNMKRLYIKRTNTYILLPTREILRTVLKIFKLFPLNER